MELFKRVFKTRRCCSLVFLLLCNIVGLMLYDKNVCLNQSESKCVFNIVLLMIYFKKCTFKESRNLFFSLFSYFSVIQKMCIQNNGRAAFECIQLLLWLRKRVFKSSEAVFVIRKCMFKTSGRLLFSLLIINNYYTPKVFYQKFNKNFHEKCFLVYLANYKKPLWTAAFNLSSKQITSVKALRLHTKRWLFKSA